ncbi:unnamed protein product [Adineta steineri]|uniref:Uncharacterized protein n=1 Tax=Adineta steineri TaxID=433720 RepID=A0A819IK67_9BILA|nr:unnamed protein product [Adineta steineri]CAF3915087.1 unnamed protein product [Adineta steineri]
MFLIFSVKQENAKKIENAIRTTSPDELKLSGLNLTDADTDAIIHAIQSRRTTSLMLQLGGNKLTYVGVKQLVEAIKKNKQVIHGLGLSDNPIGDAGVQYILNLFGNDIFNTLDISATGITDNGVKVLVDGILRFKPSSPVQFLSIPHNNGITDISVNQLLRLIGLNKLVHVNIADCSLSDKAKKQLQQASNIFMVSYYRW